MKKILLAFAALTAITFVSCSKKAELTPVNIQPIVYQNDNVTVEVEPKLELLMIALRLAEVSPFSDNYYGSDYTQYLEGVDRIFQKQKDHPLVKELKGRTKNYKKSYTSILQITRYISDDMTKISVKPKELPEEMQDFWKGINFKNFIAQFNDFAVSSNFERVWLLYTPQLKNQAISVQEYFKYNKKVTDWVSSFFFDETQNPDYKLHGSITSAGKAYLLPPIHDGNKITLQAIAPAYFTKDYEWNPIQDAINFSACIILDLIRKNWDTLSSDAERIVKDIYTKNQITEKLEKENIQYMIVTVLSLASIFDYDTIKNDEEYSTSLYNAFTTQFMLNDPDKLLSLVDYYKNNRSQFPNFQTFVENYLPAALKDF